MGQFESDEYWEMHDWVNKKKNILLRNSAFPMLVAYHNFEIHVKKASSAGSAAPLAWSRGTEYEFASAQGTPAVQLVSPYEHWGFDGQVMIVGPDSGVVYLTLARLNEGGTYTVLAQNIQLKGGWEVELKQEQVNVKHQGLSTDKPWTCLASYRQEQGLPSRMGLPPLPSLLPQHSPTEGETHVRDVVLMSSRFDGGEHEARVRAVATELKHLGSPVFIVSAGDGEDYGPMTCEGLWRSFAMVAFASCSPAYGAKTTSNYCTYWEVKYCYDNNVPILPVQLGETFPPVTGESVGSAMNSTAFPPSLVRIDGRQLDAKQLASRLHSRIQGLVAQREAAHPAGAAGGA